MAGRRSSRIPTSKAPTREVYPSVTRDEAGLKMLFRQFSFPGGIPSHAAPETPGSIHEGGELGYSLSHAFGAVFDNPRLIAACVVGDGEAETGPLATAWHSNKFLNPVTDGAVLPILHLNGYKIANPAVLARITARRTASSCCSAAAGTRTLSRGRPGGRASRTWRRRSTGSCRISATFKPRRDSRQHVATALADDRPRHAEGLDRPARRRRTAGRGHVSRAPGAAVRSAAQPGSPRAARTMAEELPAGGTVRREWRARRPAAAASRRWARDAWVPIRMRTADCC